MTQVPYTLRVLAGETETRYGERLYHSGAVHIVEKSAKRLSCKVADGEMYDVVFTDDGESRCSCPIYEEAGACRHVVAAMIKCQDEGAISFLVGVNKSVGSNGSIGIGFQGATNNCGLVTNDGSGIVGGKSYTAGEDGNSDNDNFVWAIPVSVSVWF